MRNIESKTWGDLRVWPEYELSTLCFSREAYISLTDEQGFEPHQRSQAEIPQKGMKPLKLCEFQDARTFKSGNLFKAQNGCFISCVTSTEYFTEKLSDRETWGETWLELVPEPENELNQFSVAVDLKGKTIGYLCPENASQFQWLIRALNDDGYRCFSPGFIEHFDSAWIALPAVGTWTLRFPIQKYETTVKGLFDTIPPELIIEELEFIAHPQLKELRDLLWSIRNQAQWAFPANKDQDYPILWWRIFQQIRAKQEQAKAQRKRKKKRLKNSRENSQRSD